MRDSVDTRNWEYAVGRVREALAESAAEAERIASLWERNCGFDRRKLIETAKAELDDAADQRAKSQ
jgi:hypothetical protein